ncbi:hypothetical protein MFLAVUS_008225 [Mucor flavus]|uniref:Protein kinase domain-containing protein n=1 Tax=Mucor flavus TaxID=439312 RepID=A0ABP9Z6M8_9FUNG
MKKKFNSSSQKEYKTLKRMSIHPNIVRLHESFLGPSKEFYFIMEYMNGGNLYQYINEHKERKQTIKASDVKSILVQILSALNHIHQVECIFHRDMKPENILITDSLIVKLADFGLATDIKKITPYTDYVCTRWYRAPEVLLKSSSYSFQIDLWAVGVIFAELITLHPLFPGTSEIDQLSRICNILGTPSSTSKGEWKQGIKLAHKIGFQFPKTVHGVDSLATVLLPHTLSDQGLDLLSQLLQFNPCKRINSTNALLHPYFNSYPSSLPRATSFPSIIYQYQNTRLKRSASDLSIPPIKKTGLWAHLNILFWQEKKKHISKA